ncbi:hypothetical protein GOBAR_AA05208 [Gossypium barbadense]|uniref:Myb/SANT-like DNA-binding domain-containing protein n=1 Tax=Gossypium barbadense TaxID=3634 RepID=A0A2P5YIG5_GOSBA|nr:hypothetical protein GOBAR_AA05208 [Gossypium barbadense]
MEKETNQENPSLLSNNNISITKEDSSPKKHPGNTAAAGGGDRLKRDEWSEGAVSSLLEAYENKWVLRNRAKLKGHDWEDVARYVSARANCTKSPKTQTQCKNKIESMKKRYRSESATADGSSWPLYPRLDLLLRGSTAPPPPPLLPPQLQPSAVPQAATPISTNPPFMTLPEPSMMEDGAGTKLSGHLSDKIAMETDSKQARMETMKEIEKMRVEAEAKRGEMDLKRTEIIAKTQLEIARLFAGSNKGVDSSLRIGRN